eukprot:4212818-Pleurochrysis_carterae.AAC.1
MLAHIVFFVLSSCTLRSPTDKVGIACFSISSRFCLPTLPDGGECLRIAAQGASPFFCLPLCGCVSSSLYVYGVCCMRLYPPTDACV